MSNQPKHLILVACLLAGVAFGLAGLPFAAVATAQSPVCTERLRNGGFEANEAWSLPVTAYRAAYSTAQQHSGNRSLRAGIVEPVDNVFSYSSASQTVQIPTGTQTATLSLWLYTVTTEEPLPSAAGADDEATVQAIADAAAPTAPLAGDRQYILLTNPQNTVLARLLWTRTNTRAWQALTFDLTPYTGQTVRVLFGAYNDGADGVTALFVDDVTLVTCSTPANYLPIIIKEPATPTPTLVSTTPPPTGSPTPVLTPSPTPSATVVWTNPAQAIEVFSPVAAGLYHSPIVVNGFSQTFEGNVNLRLTDKNGQMLAERNTQGGSVDGFAFFDSYLRFTVSETISGTVEVFETSAKDGSEINKVTIPVVLLPGQRVIDLNRPMVGDAVCNPVLVNGYSNTFEANVVVTLNQRNGTQLALTTALGGNLGVYADFSTVISGTVVAPQPALVGAYEGSAAGFGLIDHTRVPVALYPADSSACP
ncbi:MAG: hypothetical protein DYG89_02890 [Caldilinea sp. CFX5]|nr:hypothetical protein [Caldilinea sp. CFX5]